MLCAERDNILFDRIKTVVGLCSQEQILFKDKSIALDTCLFDRPFGLINQRFWITRNIDSISKSYSVQYSVLYCTLTNFFGP